MVKAAKAVICANVFMAISCCADQAERPPDWRSMTKGNADEN
jgi:hypothetical protein